MNETILHRVYVWQLPVRLCHWINAVCIVILIATGLMIGRPLAIQLGSEASFSYWFGTVRFIHFTAAFVLFFSVVVRIYWGFVGNRYANWHNFIPYRKQQLREILQVLKTDILLAPGEPVESVGHNALAGLTYFLAFLALLFQVATGFGLYSAMSDAWLPGLFAWIVPLMGGDFAVRQWHHVMMWFFVVFSMVHIYLVFYHDDVEARGILSSMGAGWKFIEPHVAANQHGKPGEGE